MLRRSRALLPMLLASVVFTMAAVASPLILEVKDAVAGFDQRVRDLPVLTITLTDGSKEAFGRFTQANVGRKVELRIDGKVVLAPVIREPTLGGVLQISGSSTELEELRQLAKRLSGGSAKVEVESWPTEPGRRAAMPRR